VKAEIVFLTLLALFIGTFTTAIATADTGTTPRYYADNFFSTEYFDAESYRDAIPPPPQDCIEIGVVACYDYSVVNSWITLYGYRDIPTILKGIVEKAGQDFSQFDISLRVIAVCYVTTPDDLTGYYQAMHLVNETGFSTGTYATGLGYMDVLVLFTRKGGILLGYDGLAYYDSCVILERLRDYDVDKMIFAHELSHLLGCPDHRSDADDGWDYCRMSQAWVWSWKYLSYVPRSAVTHNWCSDCVEEINAHKARFDQPTEPTPPFVPPIYPPISEGCP